jgi:hypothetical protein
MFIIIIIIVLFRIYENARQEITTCWKKLANSFVGEPIDCPSHVLGV